MLKQGVCAVDLGRIGLAGVVVGVEVDRAGAEFHGQAGALPHQAEQRHFFRCDRTWRADLEADCVIEFSELYVVVRNQSEAFDRVHQW